MRPRRYLAVVAAIVVLAACSSPTSPDHSGSIATQPHGRLAGQVTIGPNCPVQSDTNPCPASPEAYGLRKILVYDEAKTSLLNTVDIDSKGAYFIDLAPAKYTIDLRGAGIDRSNDLPQTVEIRADSVTTLNVAIDTGLR